MADPQEMQMSEQLEVSSASPLIVDVAEVLRLCISAHSDPQLGHDSAVEYLGHVARIFGLGQR